MVISIFQYGFESEDIGTIFWNNGTRSPIRNQNFKNQSEVQMSWGAEKRIHSGIAYMT